MIQIILVFNVFYEFIISKNYKIIILCITLASETHIRVFRDANEPHKFKVYK